MPGPGPAAENPFAGQGAVMLDIGGDIGALIVTMPATMAGLEVEIIPAGTDTRHTHDDHAHDDAHTHDDHTHPHSHAPGAPPHVAVVARPTPDGAIVHSLVFGELTAGRYDLYVRPDGPVQLTAEVAGGQVTEASWPALRP